MKKIVLFLLVAIITAGAVWGQFAVTDIPDSIDIIGFGGFFVDGVESAEYKYSQGVFDSYADNFLWFNGYDPKVGTFLLLGGQVSSSYALNIGFAKTLKAGYLGLYYGGSLVNADGTSNGQSGKDNLTSSNAVWDNKLSIFFGTEKLGGFRFDLLMPGSEYDDTLVDGIPGSQSVTSPPRIGLGWGNKLGKMDVYAQLGYQFADMDVTGDTDGKKDTLWGESRMSLQAGVTIPLSSSETSPSEFSADLIVGNQFGASGKGDYTLASAYYVYGGIFMAGLDASYKQTINLGKLSLGFKPGLTLGFTIDDSNSAITGSKTVNDLRKTIGFEAALDLSIGVKFQINDKFNLYTGLGLELIDFKSGSYAEGNDDKFDKINNPDVKSSAWQISGINWKDSNSKLRFGLTFEPVKDIVIGAGISSLLDKIFDIDFGSMNFGTNLNDNSSNTELGWLSDNFFGGLTFDLIITVKF